MTCMANKKATAMAAKSILKSETSTSTISERRAKAGSDHPNNLQLPCQACNSTKGKGTQEELDSRFKESGVLS